MTLRHSVIRQAPGFSLVELLVVIAIIGILAGILIASLSGGTDSARAAQCLANMKNLANACQVYGMNTGYYPNAGSVETLTMDESNGRNRAEKRYMERPGWISWDSKGAYDNGDGTRGSKSHKSNAVVGLYCDDREKGTHALTNGCLWTYVARNRQTYVCPSHVLKMRHETPPLWSYLMNGAFGWDVSEGSSVYSDTGARKSFGHLARADRTLLFSEVPFMGYSSWQPSGTSGSTDTDPVLQFSTDGLTESQAKGSNGKAKSGNETIGANHRSGKNLLAHVVYADGHVEKLKVPYEGSVKAPKADETALKNLTTWLCAGLDVSFDGKNYKRITNDE